VMNQSRCRLPAEPRQRIHHDVRSHPGLDRPAHCATG
jgi:hypothetical protein